MASLVYLDISKCRLSSRYGLSLIEALVSLSILLFVVLIVYQTLLNGAATSISARTRLTSIKFAEMEIENINDTSYSKTPPECHLLRRDVSVDGSIRCRVLLSHLPLKGSIQVWQDDGLKVDDYLVDYSSGWIVFSGDMDQKKIIISYSYEYPRRELLTIPSNPPFKVRLNSYPLRKVYKAVDDHGNPVLVSVDYETGELIFKENMAGKSVNVDYRGKTDSGKVSGYFLAADLSSESVIDTGIKLVHLTEIWSHQDRKKHAELTYVLTK